MSEQTYKSSVASSIVPSSASGANSASEVKVKTSIFAMKDGKAITPAERKVTTADVLLCTPTKKWSEDNKLPSDAVVLKNTSEYLLYMSEGVYSVWSLQVDDEFESCLYINPAKAYNAKNAVLRAGYSSETALINKVQKMVETEGNGHLPSSVLVYGDKNDVTKVTDVKLDASSLISVILLKDSGKGRSSDSEGPKEYRTICTDIEAVKITEFIANMRSVPTDKVVFLKPVDYIEYKRYLKDAKNNGKTSITLPESEDDTTEE